MGAPLPRTVSDHRTVSDVLQDIVGNIQEIGRSEFRLAKVEVKEKAQAAAKPMVTMAIGAAVGFYALGFLLLAAVFALTIVVAWWAASLIVGVLLAIGAAIFLSMGQARLKQINPTPEKTVRTVKENVQWTKERMRSSNI
jgi:uncharacterized membrane protein YqjE